MKKFLVTAVLAFITILSCFTVVTAYASENANDPNDWEKRLIAGNTAVYTVQEDAISASGNHDRMRNVLINVSEELFGDYSVSVTVCGKKAPPYDNNTNYQLGLVPWYIDDNNYVIAYMEWGADSGRPQEMRCVQITGKINGKLLANRNGNFVEWTDLWQDGNNTAENSEIEFKVSKSRSASGVGDVFTAYVNGVNAASTQLVEYRDTVMYDAVPAYAGIYAFCLDDDVAVFSGYKITHGERADCYRRISETQSVGRTANGALWTETDGTYSVASVDGQKLSDSVALVAAQPANGYSVSATVDFAPKQDDHGVGLVGWYVDEYSYLIGGVKQIDGKWYAGFEGRISSLAEDGNKYVLTTQHIDTFTRIQENISAISSLRIMKSGSYLILYASVNDKETQFASYRNVALYNGGTVGYAVFGCSASFGACLFGDADYVAYDWYQDGEYSVSSAKKGAVLIGADGSFTFGADAVTAENDACYAGAYRASGYYDWLTTTAAFGNETLPISKDAVYGIYGWIQDGDNYLAVYVSSNGITVENHFEHDLFSETYPLPTGFVYVGSKTLTVSVSYSGTVTVVLFDETGSFPVVGGASDHEFVMRGQNSKAEIGSGVLAGGAPVSVTNFATEGYEAYSEIRNGEWKLRGPRYSTWSTGNGSSISASGSESDDVFRTVALIPNEHKDFYCAAQINVTSMSKGENKAGIVPYYLDDNNYLFVWLDQWSGATPAINITGKIGGVPYINGLGESWNVFYADYRYLGGNNELEVQIAGDMLYVYLNRRFEPIIGLELKGFGDRLLEGSMAGVSIMRSDVVFPKGIQFGSERIFTSQEKPSVRMSGKIAEKVNVGEHIVLPQFFAASADGQVSEPIITVTDPTGEIVSVIEKAFDAVKEGVYTVSVTAENVWGNRAEPLVFKIVASDTSHKHTLSALTETRTTVYAGENVIIPIYVDETGAEANVVFTVIAPDGSAVDITGNSFRTTAAGEYKVVVSAANAEDLFFTVVAEEMGPARYNPVAIAMCFVVPVLLVAAAALVFCRRKKA